MGLGYFLLPIFCILSLWKIQLCNVSLWASPLIPPWIWLFSITVIHDIYWYLISHWYSPNTNPMFVRKSHIYIYIHIYIYTYSIYIYVHIYIYTPNTFPCLFIYSHCPWDSHKNISCFMGIPTNLILGPCADPAERSVWCHAPHGPWNPGRHWWSWMNGGPAPVDRWLSPLFIGCHPRWCRISSIHSMWIG